MDPLSAASKIAGSGLEAQATRLRIVSENIANARSTGILVAPGHLMLQHLVSGRL